VGITLVTSVDGTVRVTNPAGPTVDLSVPASGSGAGYASLTGPGQSTSPGLLVQAGGVIVNDNAGGVQLNTTGGVIIHDNNASAGIEIIERTANGAVSINGNGTGSVLLGLTGDNVQVQSTTATIQAAQQLQISSAPVTANQALIQLGPNGTISIQAPSTNASSSGIQMSSGKGVGIATAAGSLSGIGITDYGSGGVSINTGYGKLVLAKNANGSGIAGVEIASDAGVELYAASGNINIEVDPSGTGGVDLSAPQYVQLDSAWVNICPRGTAYTPTLQFFRPQFGATTPVGLRTVTGSRGGNAALTSLLAALSQSATGYGLITDASTP
jgi:hypothetical protein